MTAQPLELEHNDSKIGKVTFYSTEVETWARFSVKGETKNILWHEFGYEVFKPSEDLKLESQGFNITELDPLDCDWWFEEVDSILDIEFGIENNK